jgi:hypothetical protein
VNLVSLAIFIVVIVAVVAIVLWFVRSSGVTVPKPIQIALYAIIAIVAILFVASLAGIGPPILR